ncbi:integrase [Nocardiopsis terrae]|uniref:Site-specific recombinase XerD n=1 Tax=Nocardiopsis terrae TaxID=372655 RepID=A0ABR9HJD1_9ACTN|nr:tyrosine-type recombinase/integrase [Nocardiopsis terrae]MBE1459117.1 site-specific recombinase XerD [Nocardiopsis terrae]GHC88230.1 integrase [Nocardiopsis terrae]
MTTLTALETSYRRQLRARGLSDATTDNYLRSLRALVAWLDTNGLPKEVEQITRHQLQDFVLDTADNTSAATARFHLGNLRPFFGWLCSDEERILPRDANSATGVRCPKPKPVARPTFTGDQVAAFLRACRGSTFDDRRDTAIIRVFADTGVRISGLVGMRYTPDAGHNLENPATDVSLDTNPPLVRFRLKGGKPHLVPVSAATVGAVDRYLRARASHPKAANPALWIGRTGAISGPGVAKMLKKRAHQAGLEGVRVHTHRWRRTRATQLLDAGASAETVAELLGWSDLSMVATYASESRQRRAWNELRNLQL